MEEYKSPDGKTFTDKQEWLNHETTLESWSKLLNLLEEDNQHIKPMDCKHIAETIVNNKEEVIKLLNKIKPESIPS